MKRVPIESEDMILKQYFELYTSNYRNNFRVKATLALIEEYLGEDVVTDYILHRVIGMVLEHQTRIPESEGCYVEMNEATNESLGKIYNCISNLALNLASVMDWASQPWYRRVFSRPRLKGGELSIGLPDRKYCLRRRVPQSGMRGSGIETRVPQADAQAKQPASA